MKIVLATHVYPLNPRAPADIPGNFLPPFVHALCRYGAQVRVLAPNRPGVKTPDAGAPVTWFEWHGDERNLGRFNPANPLDAYRLVSLYRRGTAELVNLVKRERADAVLACWAVPAGAFAASMNRRFGIPYAVWSLGTDIHTSPRNPVLRPVVIGALQRAALRYANSETLRRAVEQLAGMPCGLMAIGRTLPPAAPADLPRDRVNLLFAGRFEPVKGIDLLVEAWRRVLDGKVNAHLYIAGSGSLEGPVRARVRELGLENRITFLGFLTEAPLASYLRAVDAVVIPSRGESLPTIMTEAASCGTPAVVTDVGDMGLLARRYGTAIVVEPENVEALAAGLIEMAGADRAPFRRRLGELAADFDMERSAQKLLADLEAHLGSAPQST